ncbi:MAG: carboxypeptidase-like regulatory domain-containing protein [Planctomycetaceae bacterium]|jgi:hypothetical protein|nr:carboxypeptidase-like regulatory domain-containing protein [Planctomycetaceae bacterium]
MKIYDSIALLLVCVCFCGCGNGNQQLSGKVTFPDGSPLNVGIVCFENAETNKMARGELNENGVYVVGFESEKNGIPKGTYKVFITGAILEKGINEKTGLPVTEPQIAAKYSNKSTSGLTFTADGKTKTFDIVVEPLTEKKNILK